MAAQTDTPTLPEIQKLSRRSALAGAAAALVPVPAVAAALDPDDGVDWLALWNRFIEAEAAFSDTLDPLEDAEGRAKEEYPAQPRMRAWTPVWGSHGPVRSKDGLRLSWCPDSPFAPKNFEKHVYGEQVSREAIWRHYDGYLWEKLPQEWRERFPEIFSQGERCRDRSLADLAEWEADCAAVDARYDVPRLRAAKESAEEAFEEAQEVIRTTPASGVMGVAIKLSVWFYTGGHIEASDEDEEDTHQVVAAYRDALRLAGLPPDFGSPFIPGEGGGNA